MSNSLYTIQTKEVVAILLSQSIYTASWQHVSEDEKVAYQKMNKLMRQHGIDGTENPPIWCWQTREEVLPDLARELLSTLQLQSNEYKVLKLHVPSTFYLTTSYHKWCDVLFENTDATDTLLKLDESEIQATLSYIKPDWVQSISEISVQGNLDEDYELSIVSFKEVYTEV